MTQLHTLLLQGKTAKEIAIVLNLSANQVENILKNEMIKYNCCNRIELSGVLASEFVITNKIKTTNDYRSRLHLQSN